MQDLYHPTRLGLVEPPAKVAGEDWILLYGGSCAFTVQPLLAVSDVLTGVNRGPATAAVGQCLIQLAHASGYKTVTTASPRNFALVRALGADAVFDYRDPEVVAKIKTATGDSLTKAVDAIAVLDSQRICAEALGPEGGKVVLVQAAQEAATTRKDVVLQRECLSLQ